MAKEARASCPVVKAEKGAGVRMDAAAASPVKGVGVKMEAATASPVQ